MASNASRVPEHRQNLKTGPRDARGWPLPIPSLQRFAEKCRFDATTGCVIWTGGTTQGRGNSAVYGSFWDDGRRHFAHRWAAANIHGHDIDGLQVGHCCPGRPNTLCVEHVEPTTNTENQAERNARLASDRRAVQTTEQRQFWLFVHLGIEQLPDEPEPVADNDQIPFFTPPEWLRPFMAKPEDSICPF